MYFLDLHDLSFFFVYISRSCFLIVVLVVLGGADDGIERIVAGGMELRCWQTVTGIKFVITAEPGATVDIDSVLREIYVLYAECVCKGESKSVF